MLNEVSTLARRVSLLVVLLLVMVIIAGCGGQEQTPPTPTEDVFVDPLPSDRAEMAISGPNGNEPCGLGQVNWGYRVFNVGDHYPACEELLPDLTVYCLNGEAQWVPDNVSDVHVSMQTETVAFEVRQEGICGLFPSP